MKIKLALLRKIIREEIQRSKIDEIGRSVFSTAGYEGGSAFSTEPSPYKAPKLTDLVMDYGTDKIPAKAVFGWLSRNKQLVINPMPTQEVPYYRFVDDTLYGVGADGHDVVEVKVKGPGKYEMVELDVPEETKMARSKYSNPMDTASDSDW